MRRVDASTLRLRLLLAAGALTAASLQRGAKAEAATKAETVCLPPNADDSCPSDEEAIKQIHEQHPDQCGPNLEKPGATFVDKQCCYEVNFECTAEAVGCSISGVPLRIERRPLEATRRPGAASLAQSPDVAGLTSRQRDELALHWARVGAAEHVSAAGFRRFAVELADHEAPAELRRGAKLAAQDEARHARRAFALASAFAGVPIGPGPAAREPYVRRSLADFAASTALEGCTSEPLSVCLLAEALRGANDPATAAVLASLLRDEPRHAELAWQTLAWALRKDPRVAGRIDAALEQAIAALAADEFAHPGGLERFGVLRPSQVEACRLEAIGSVIEPRRAALALR